MINQAHTMLSFRTAPSPPLHTRSLIELAVNENSKVRLDSMPQDRRSGSAPCIAVAPSSRPNRVVRTYHWSRNGPKQARVIFSASYSSATNLQGLPGISDAEQSETMRAWTTLYETVHASNGRARIGFQLMLLLLPRGTPYLRSLTPKGTEKRRAQCAYECQR